MFATLSFETSAADWFDLFRQASVQSLLVLAVVIPFWLALRRHISHGFAHGLFLLVPAKFAAAIVCGLLALQWSVEIPLPGISKSGGQSTVGIDSDTSSETSLPGSLAKPDRTIPPDETGFESATNSPSLTGVNGENRPTLASIPPEIEAVESSGQQAFEMPRGSALAFFAWILICAILAARFVFLTLLMRTRAKRSSSQASAQLSATVAEVSNAMGLRRCPAVLITPAVAAPAVFGLIRPKLLIPAGFETDFDDSETRWAIAHELAHLKRRDLWAVAFERCVGLAGYFHPALWLARRATGTFRELACDDVAARVTGLPPRICAETFLKILVWADRQATPAPLNPLVLGLNPRYPAIRRRIENMTDQTISKRVVPSWFRYALSGLALAAVLPVSPRFVAAQAEAPASQAPAPVLKPDFEIRAVDTSTNQPVAKAVVHFQTDRSSGKVETDANGQALIPFEPGLDDFIAIRVVSDSHVPFRLRRSSIEDPDFPPVSPLVAKLQPGMSIGGQVIVDEGEVVPNARVLVTYQAKPNENGSTSYRCEVVRTGPDGRWKTAQVDPYATRIDVAALHPAFAIDWAGTEADPRGRVEPPFETLKAGTHMFRLKSGQTLRGRVLDFEGKPIAGAEVCSDEWPVEFGDAPLLTDAQGKFRIGNLGMVRTAVKIAVHKPGLGWCVKSIDVQDQDRVATFQLVPGRKLTGRVTDTDGKPLAYVRIDDTMLPRSLVAPDAVRRTDSDGRFEIADLPADFISLIFSKSGYTGYEAKIDTATTADVQVVLSERNLVEGRVTDAATGQPVADFRVLRMAHSGGREVAFPVHGRHVDGRFRTLAWPYPVRDEVKGAIFPDYRLRIEAPGYQPMTTDLMKVDDPPKSLNLALKRVDPADSKSIEGRVLKPDGTPAANAAVGYFTPKDGGWPRYVPEFQKGRLTGLIRNASAVFPPTKVEPIRTDADGKFRIPADVGKIGWVVTHDSGVFRSPEAEASIPGELVAIQLGPYAFVQGVFVRDGKPQANTPVWYAGPGFGASIPLQDSVMTDDQGRYELVQVVPGTLRLAFPGRTITSFWEIVSEPFEVKAGASLRVETSIGEFGHEQVVFDDAGKELARTGSGAFDKTFAVYGRATDAVTGKLLPRMRALFFTGQQGDDTTLYVQWVGPGDGRFTAYHTVSNLSVQETRKVDPYLVVFAPGYEPFVSPRPIPRGDAPVRMDVALKPVPMAEPQETSGQIVRVDGKPASRAEIAFTTKTPVVRAGHAQVRWQVFVQPGSQDIDGPYPVQADEQGRFRITTREPIDQLTVMDSTGCALVRGEDLAKSQGVVRLGPWARVEGRADVKQPAEGQVWAQVQYRDVAWQPMMSPPAATLRPDGTFGIERVLPGKHSLGLMINKPIDYNSSSYSKLDPPVGPVSFETVAGQTTKLTIAEKPAETRSP